MDFTTPYSLIQSLPKLTGSMELLSFVYPICLFITYSLASHIIFPVKEGQSGLLFFCLSGKSYLFSPQFLVAGNFFRRQKKNESIKEKDVCSSVYAHILCLIWVSTNQKIKAFYFMMKISFSYFLVGGESKWWESGGEIQWKCVQSGSELHKYEP